MICASIFCCSCNSSSVKHAPFTDTPTSGEINILADESYQPLIQVQIDTFREIYKNAAILREHGFAYVWCKNGKILARRDDTAQVHSINTQEDISRLAALGDSYIAEQLNRTKKPKKNSPKSNENAENAGSSHRNNNEESEMQE